MKKIFTSLTLLGVFCLMFSSGCQQQQDESPKPGVVEANPTYIHYFGEPPYETEGRAFARVGFLPRKGNPGKIRAIPLFLFSEQDQLRQILDRLTSDKLFLPQNGELYSPFPPELKVAVTTREDRTVRLSLTAQKDWSAADLQAAVNVMIETAVQFPEITKVRILLNGQPLAQMPENGFAHNPQRLTAVGDPALVMLLGNWEKGAESPKEIFVEFDRPVTVKSFQLFDKKGKKIEGEYFTSAFQMAVVVHPADPGRFQEGTMLRAEWDVVDTLGRANKGESTLPLNRVEH